MLKRGLTLIELLVVIAIIGLLSSFFFVNLSKARARARDARIFTAMDQIRTRATIIYYEEQSYAKVGCTKVEDPCTCKDPVKEIEILCTDIVRNALPGTVDFNVGGQEYCIKAQLKGSKKFWCIDNSLNSGEYDASPCSPSHRSCTP